MFCCPLSLHFPSDSSHGKRFHALFVRNSIPKCFARIYFLQLCGALLCMMFSLSFVKGSKSAEMVRIRQRMWTPGSNSRGSKSARTPARPCGDLCVQKLVSGTCDQTALSFSGAERKENTLSGTTTSSSFYEKCAQRISLI